MLRVFREGFTAGAVIMALGESAMGRDGYARFVQEHWISSWVGVPLGIAGLTLAGLRYARALKHP